MRDSHLRAFLTAIVETDLDKLSESEHDYISVYLTKLTMQNASLNLVLERSGFMNNSIIVSEEITPTMKVGKCSDDDLTNFTFKELFKRQCTVSCISTVETGLDILSNAITCSNWTESDDSLLEEQQKCDRAPALVRYILDFPKREYVLNVSLILHY